MKKSSLFLSLLALSLPPLMAAQYNITLTSAERFTDCTVIYKSSSSTKFRGKDKSGKQVTKEVPTRNIIMIREVIDDTPEEKPETTPQQPETATPAQPADADAAKADSQKPEAEPQAEQKAEPDPIADGNIAQREGEDKAKDATLRLREKLALVETKMAKITKPSRSLTSQASALKRNINRQLENLDKRALTVAKLQDEFNKAGAADFVFTKVTADQRDQYMRDGAAAHAAMKNDMKERKGRRKVGGLDKFEIMRERYQGIPEYKESYEWYIKTLHALEKKWTNMLAKEDAKRKRLIPDRKKAADKLDERQYQELAAQLKEDGDDINTVWFVPQSRNRKMLSIAVNKVKDAIRRNEGRELDKEVGTVPSLINQYWENMDQVRMDMINGNLEGAEERLKENHAYSVLLRLKTYLLPNDYRQPIVDQYKEMQQEIQKRMREHRRLKGALERETMALDRSISQANAQIDNVLNAAQAEIDTDAGENTMEVEQTKEKKPAEAPATKPETQEKK